MARAYRHQHLAAAPRGWRVRSKRTDGHVLRVAFPPGPRRRGAGRLLEILHPKRNPACENGECTMRNPAEELLIFGNPSKHRNAGEYVKEMADRLEEDYRSKLRAGMEEEEAMSAAIAASIAGPAAIKEFKRRIGNPLSKTYDIIEITPSDRTHVMYHDLARTEAKQKLNELRRRTEGSGWRYIMKRFHVSRENRRGAIGNHKPGCKCAFCKRIRARGSNPGTGRSQRRRRPGSSPRRRRNPNEVRQAVSLFQTFHGRDPQEIAEKHRSAAMRSEYTALGDLEYLIVQPPDRPAVKINFDGDGVKLASAPNGRQLYLIGGNQSLSSMLEKFADDPDKDFIDLGEALEVQYEARKIHGNFQPVSWYHKFGKERGQPLDGDLPRLMYDKIKKEIFFVGGEYFIDTNVAISPGIEN